MGLQLLFPSGVGLVLEQVQRCGEIVHLIARRAAAARLAQLAAVGQQRSIASMNVISPISRLRLDVLARGLLCGSLPNVQSRAFAC
jgi:hypothetical protein